MAVEELLELFEELEFDPVEELVVVFVCVVELVELVVEVVKFTIQELTEAQ